VLTDDEFSQIVTSLGFDTDTPLNLDNISSIFRRGWLARKLKLSVKEFLLITQLAGLDPSTTPDPANPSILRLIELVHRLRKVSLKPVQALYSIWNQDISGKSVPDEREILEFARTLRANFAAIESEFAFTSDPDGQIARSRMALVYGNEATDFFFGLLNNTLTTTVTYSHPQLTLEQPILNVSPGRLAYDDFRKQLTFKGVLTVTIRDAFNAVAGVTTQFQTAINNLNTQNLQTVNPFFERYPELQPLYDAFAASSEAIEKKRSDMLENFLPGLKRRRKQQQAMQALGAAAKVDVSFASSLLDNALVLHAAENNTLTALETIGLTAQFFFRDTATGAAELNLNAQANLNYGGAGNNPLPVNPVPGNAISAIWSGYLEAPENGFYNLRIEADAGATVALTLAGVPVSLTLDGTRWSNSSPIELRAGTLYAIELKAEKIKDTLSVRWQTTGRGWEVIPSAYLYSATLTGHLRTAYLRFLKITSLAAVLKLTANEIAYLAAQPNYKIGGEAWLNRLPITGTPDNATSTALLPAFNALLIFATIKAELSPDDERLLAVLQNPTTATANPASLLFSLTQWETNSLNALLTRFSKAISDLSQIETFNSIYDAYQIVKQIGTPANALIQATTNEPTATTVRDFQSALRARYDESSWLRVLKQINDKMRRLQRDALVAYILHQMRSNPSTVHIDTPDKLFEYFLMDVQMEPCMQTSRIRHALSSVQLFIERCLMNLEPRVAPSSFKSKERKQWEWMKRYRVWEANRKVFLYPENWLEPELRDDQSPFFKETMSELLQGDITEDRAAVALLNYLSKLEEVAKLEPCGIHYVENDPGTIDDIAHVVARTTGASRKYFYRRREYGYWTPWEQIRLDIEDNPVLPVVWNDRLFLFWLRILRQAPLDGSTTTTSPGPVDNNNREKTLAEVKLSEVKQSAQNDAKANTKVTVQAVLCWSEYFNSKWQATKTSDVNRPAELGQFRVEGSNAFDRSATSLSVYEEEGVLIVRIYNPGGSAAFKLYNTHSTPEPIRFSVPDLIEDSNRINIYTEGDTLSIDYRPGGSTFNSVLKNKKSALNDRAVKPNHYDINGWYAPFFYEDNRHVFYVTTAERIIQIPQWKDFGIVVIPPIWQLDIPPLVLEPMERIPDLIGPVSKQPGFGIIDRSPIERYVTEDAYIARGIGSVGTVRFGNKEIGPTGSQVNTMRTR
jgi:hypothetical protein